MGLSVEGFDQDIQRLNQERATIVGRAHKAGVPLPQQDQARIDSIDAQLRSLKKNRHSAAKLACAEGGWPEVIAECRREPSSRWRVTYSAGEVEEGSITHFPASSPETWDNADFYLDIGGGSPGEPRRISQVASIELLWEDTP